MELVFREGRLQWRPPIEEVRAKLYSGLRRFLAIPTNFRGVGDSSEGQFSGLVRRSAYLFGRVYQDAEILLAAIEETRLKWIPLSAPARIDPGERYVYLLLSSSLPFFNRRLLFTKFRSISDSRGNLPRSGKRRSKMLSNGRRR